MATEPVTDFKFALEGTLTSSREDTGLGNSITGVSYNPNILGAEATNLETVTSKTINYPEGFGPPAGQLANDSPTIQALLNSGIAKTQLGISTPAGSSSPNYVIGSSVSVPVTRDLTGQGIMSRAAPTDTGSGLTNSTMFLVNVDASHNWIQSFPSVLATTISKMLVRANSARDNGVPVLGFEFGGACKFSDIWFLGMSGAIKQIPQYSDLVTIERIQAGQSFEGNAYVVDLPFTGDGVRVSQLMGGEQYNAADPTRSIRGKTLHFKYKGGATVDNIINGDVDIESSRAVFMTAFHEETGVVKFTNSSGEFSNSLLYMRNKTGLKATPLVFEMPMNEGSVRSSVISAHDLGFVYMNALPGGYATDIPNFTVTGNGSAARILLQVENLYRWDQGDDNFEHTQSYGVTCGDSDFDNYSHIASQRSTFRNGQWSISGDIGAIDSSVGIDTGSSALSGHRTWGAASGTYYYRAVALLDKKRMIGRIGSNEKSFVVTNGGQAPSVVLVPEFRKPCFIRLYRGTATNTYSEYVDVPILSASRLNDSGLDVGGYQWISRAPGAVDAVNNFGGGISITPGSFATASDAYGRARVNGDTVALPTTGGWRSGDEIVFDTPTSEASSWLYGYRRITNCLSSASANVLNTDWIALRTAK